MISAANQIIRSIHFEPNVLVAGFIPGNEDNYLVGRDIAAVEHAVAGDVL